MSAIIPIIALHQRRRLGSHSITKHAIAVPPAAYQRTPGFAGRSSAAVAEVVVIVRVAVAALVLVMVTGLVEPKLRAGRSTAPVGLAVIFAVKVTFPVKPPLGVTVIVDAFPLVAPGDTDKPAPETVNVGTITVT
jgi:hypothetical protein